MRAVGVLVTIALVAVSLMYLDLGPVRVEFISQDHRQHGANAGAHFGTRCNSRNCVVGLDSNERVWPKHRRLDRGANGLIRAAPADVSCHRLVDVRVVGLAVILEQRRSLHHLAGLAVTALRNLEPNPCLLDWMEAAAPESLDGCNFTPDRTTHRCHARPNRLAALAYRASPAKTYAAAKFCPHQPQLVAQIPKQRHLRITIERLLNAVDSEPNHRIASNVLRGYDPSRSRRGPSKCGRFMDRVP